MNVPEPIIDRPSALLSLTEAHRAVIEIASLNLSRGRLRKISPLGDGHPVMVLPGFMGDDGYNAAMRRFLSGINYSVHGWAWAVTSVHEAACLRVCGTAYTKFMSGTAARCRLWATASEGFSRGNWRESFRTRCDR